MLKVIFWDFDGVLMDSNSIRDLGFEKVLSDFPSDQVIKLLEFHRANGGLSRYVKFRYFFEKIRGEEISEDEIDSWALRFSDVVINLLLNPDLLIKDTIDFVRNNQGKYKMHITSGSDENELRFICHELGIYHMFDSIHGSPKAKKDLVKQLIDTHHYNNDECVLIGDSINDYHAAIANNIDFITYNNIDLSIELLSTSIF